MQLFPHLFRHLFKNFKSIISLFVCCFHRKAEKLFIGIYENIINLLITIHVTNWSPTRYIFKEIGIEIKELYVKKGFIGQEVVTGTV